MTEISRIKHQPYDISWSLAELWDFGANPHLEAIMRFIEPKLIRGVYLPCWLWSGKMQQFNKGTVRWCSYPIGYIPIDMTDFRRGRKVEYIHRYMAKTFFVVGPKEIVYRTCRRGDCVNPHHFAISYRNDPNFN